jgi:hypothetical protein
MPADQLGDFDVQIEHEQRCVVRDRIAGADAGRPVSLARSFVALSGAQRTRVTSEEGEDSDDVAYESALEGKTVLFAWSEESAAFEAAFEAGTEGDSGLLEGLAEDMDLRALLPTKSLELGESYAIEPAAFAAILDPGGDLALRDPDDEDAARDDPDDQLHGNLTGVLRATFREVRAEDGGKFAVLALSVETSTWAEESPGMEETTRTELEFLLEGELLWDLEHGHARTLTLSGENELKLIIEARGELDGERYEQTQTMVFRGAVRYAMTVERE